MDKFEILMHLQLRDQITKEVWQSRNHNENKIKDDWHGDDGLKGHIISSISKKLKKQFGDNCDIEIRNGIIVIVSQIYNEETGTKKKIPKKTELNARDYFDKLTKFIVVTALKEIKLQNLKLFVIERSNGETENSIIVTINLLLE